MPKHARAVKTDDSWNDENVSSGYSPEEGSFEDGIESESGAARAGQNTAETGETSGDVDQATLMATEEGLIEVDPWDASREGAALSGKDGLNPHQRKSRKTKRILIVVLIILVCLIGVLAYFTYALFSEASREASKQAGQVSIAGVTEMANSDPSDSTTATIKATDVPDLTQLIGKNESEALQLLGTGAIVVSSTPQKEEGNPVRTEVKISLSEEPTDARSGSPSVYLGLDGAGVIVRAGYSCAITTLGYGASSFSDVVSKDFIIENTLNEAGLQLEQGSVGLPTERSEYTTYKEDNKTIEKESFSFGGEQNVDGLVFEWSAVLRYDYTVADMSGNLADTIRQIYIYIYSPDAVTPAHLLPPESEEPPAA